MIPDEIREVLSISQALEITLSEAFEEDVNQVTDTHIKKALKSLEALSRARMIFSVSMSNWTGAMSEAEIVELIKPLLEDLDKDVKH